jgi:hypothetical protein
MGYHVHILRTRSGEKIPITAEEVSQSLAGNSGFPTMKRSEPKPPGSTRKHVTTRSGGASS